MTPLSKILYTTRATAVGGRSGPVRTDDGVLDLTLASPRRKVPGATNPEQLFAAGYAGCFGSALAEVGPAFGLDATRAQVTAAVELGTTDSGFGLAVALHVTLADADPDVLAKSVDMAHQVCPYSAAVRGNVEVTITSGT